MICRRAYSNNVLGSDNVLGLASCRRFSFAVCFSRRIDDCSGFAGSSVGVSPLKIRYIFFFLPSASADGKGYRFLLLGLYAGFFLKTAHFVPFLEKVQKKGLVEACRKTYLNN